MKRKIFAYSAFLCLISSVFAQESFFDNYVYQNWSSLGGLNGATATDIIQTSDGYLNIGTYEGLIRFDGVEFTTIRRGKNNDYTFASVRTVMEDSKGQIWIGSNDEGLFMHSESGNKSFTIENGLPNNSVRALCEDQNGNIWIGTAAGVVYLTPTGHLITPQFQAGTVAEGIIAVQLYCDTAGRIWLITANNRGLFLYANGLFCNIKQLEGFGDYLATSIMQDLSGDFLIAMGHDGIIKVHNGKYTALKTGTMVDNIPTWSIFVNNDGSIWFGTEKGLVTYSNGKYTEYASGNEKISKINKIINDREGNIWFATDKNGVGKLSNGRFKMTKLKTATNAICEDFSGKMWMGTDEGVLCYEDENHFTENNLTRITKGIRIRHVETALNGDILVSCYTKPGQIRYNPKTGKIQNWTTDNGLAGNKVRVATEISPGKLYVGTTTGLSIINSDGSIKNIRQIDGLKNEYIMCIYKDKNGIVFVGTDGGGIYLLKDDIVFAHFSSEDGLAGNVIFKINQDKDGNYWICTGGGISRCKAFDSVHSIPTEFDNINSDQGIGTDSIFQAILDHDNNVWMVSNYGISSMSLDKLNNVTSGKSDNLDIKFYSRNDGLDSSGATSTALSICDKDGRLWLTLIDGFALYDPVKTKQNHTIPLVHIETVTVDNVDYTNLNKEIVLRPGTKRVDIKFTGLSFDAPERINFIHMLSNFEDSYSEPNPGRIVSYTNLKPGRHTFFVKAINGDGIISKADETVIFVQKPFFWQMPIFWIVSVGIIVGFAFSIVFAHQKRIERENIRLEKMVQVRTAELAEEKNKSEFLLHSILPDKIANQLRDNIHSIGEHFDDVTVLFSDIVSFTKTSSNHTAEEIVSSLNDLFSRFDERAKNMGVEKIKTIGDAYMAACGIPTANKNHAKIMVEFAKGMYEDLEEYNKIAKIQFNIRIGLNCGPVTAGVIGKTKFIYDIWGDTVNVASRMETVCNPSGIRATEAFKNHLENTDIKFSEPIECDVKGKGIMTTYDIIV